MEKLFLNIDGTEYKAAFDKNDESVVYINEKPYKIEMLKKYEDNIYSFAANQKLILTEFDFDESGNLIMSYEGLSYEIKITDEARKMLEKYIRQSGGSSSAGEGSILAPMPGMIVKILVKEGLPVSVGDKLAIVEAMKMENSITSPVTGTVASIKAQEGQPVEKGAVIIEIDTGKEI